MSGRREPACGAGLRRWSGRRVVPTRPLAGSIARKRGGSSIASARRRSCWTGVVSVRWSTLPAEPWNSPFEHPQHPVELPRSQVVLDLANEHLVGGVAGKDPAAHRDPFPGHREPDHHLRQIRAAVLRVAEAAQALKPLLLVGLVLVLDLEVGRARVEEDHVDLEVEQVGDGEEHLALDLLLAAEQEVHRPVEHLRVGTQLAHAGKVDVLACPLERRTLRRGGKRPVAGSARARAAH
jgi:hypothetical protein